MIRSQMGVKSENDFLYRQAMIIESEDDGMALKAVKGIFFDVGWTLLYQYSGYVNKIR